MRNEIIFFDDYSFKCKGTLNKNFLEITDDNVRGWFSQSVKEFNEIFENYQKALSDDGKITGPERSELMSELDDFFNLLITFYIFIVEDKDKTFEVYIVSRDFRFTCSIVKHNWTASGSYPELFLKATHDFKIFYQNILYENFKKLISEFKDFPVQDLGCEDTTIDPYKRNSLLSIIEELFYQVLKIRFQIEKCMIND